MTMQTQKQCIFSEYFVLILAGDFWLVTDNFHCVNGGEEGPGKKSTLGTIITNLSQLVLSCTLYNGWQVVMHF